ncbi:uncharacterized protein LOC129913494 isoform X4 [Episyrphus balteatus]|uniref:uncharacterized protein LOC129913494 isoform X4 n=1 Tax=Episyrphus balteatus TaxID=286459 RepID=UPI00248647C6|nr:uncharacterized protein LOC129913494 isoform X4 [Episyrphus balteatus]
MATQSVNNALKTFYHHQRQEHLHQNHGQQQQKHKNITTTTTTTATADIQEKMWWKRKPTLKTAIQSRKWKKTRNILNLMLPTTRSAAMFTTLILILVVVSGSTVHAAQRDSSLKPKAANSLNALSGNGVDTAANLNASNISNGNRVNRTVSSSNENAMIASSNSVTATTIGTSSSSSSTAITTTSRNSGGSNYKGSSSSVHRNTIEVNEENRNGPYFDKASSKNITALLGKTAYLNCRVKNLGNKTMLLQVSWVRHRDIHLLTVGRYTYTSDQRFRAIHQPQTEDWILQIKYPQHRDSGIYECQVSTTPHMSHYIHLNVVEPSTQIIGAPDLYIESGSTINLTCVILNSPEPPAYIFWNHNSAIINYDSPRGGVSVVTNKGETTTSFLLIKSARPSDSGQYQCNPSNSKSKGVTVHVLNGTA